MSGKKGMKHYPESYKSKIVNKIEKGEISIRGFSRESGIDRTVLQRWRREGQRFREECIQQKQRGRHSTRPITTQRELELENSRLTMENELLRDFLRVAGRK